MKHEFINWISIQSWRFCRTFTLMILAWFTAFEVGAEYADVVLNRNAEKNDMRPVVFPHWFHRIRFRCKVCHGELGFIMRAGANEIDMGDIIDGKYCGMCHNGEIAWSVDNCDLCHSGKPGLKTGIRGSNETGGPGRW